MKKAKRVIAIVLFALMLTSSMPFSAVKAQALSATEITQIRNNLVSYFHQMATVKWVCGAQFVAPAINQTYYKGQTYYGLPYAGKQGSAALSLEMFKNAMTSGNTISRFIGQSDCSTSMGVAYKKYAGIPMLWCPNEFSSAANGFVKVGSVGDYSALMPGDVLVKGNSHVMMVVSVNKEKKTVTVIHQSSAYYKYDASKDTTGDANSTMQTRNCSWGVNQVKSFALLKSGSYQGYSLSKLIGSNSVVSSPGISVANAATGQKVTLSCGTSGATIYYTTDGKDPISSNTRVKYTNPFTISSSLTVKACATKSGMLNSSVLTKSITVPKVEKPVFSNQISGSGYNVSITSKTSGSTIYYTVNGSTPTTSSIKYNGNIYISNNTTLKAIAVKSGMGTSDISQISLSPVPPTAPVIRLHSSDIAKGEALQVEWNAVNNATEYDVHIVSSNGQDIVFTTKGTLGAVEIAEPGSYSVTVTANNAFGKSPVSNTLNAVVHDDVKVTFLNDNGTPISTQFIKYGGNAVAPAAPSKVGHNFIGWKGIYAGVKNDVSIVAEFLAEEYKITFVDNTGKVLKTKQVKYGEAFGKADIPVVSAPTGYEFVGWVVRSGNGNSYESANGDVTFEPSFAWKNVDLPLAVDIVKSERKGDSSGYTLSLKVTNGTAEAIDAKLVSVIKTTYDKMLVTEITAVSVPASASNMEQTVQIPCKDVGKVAEVYLVANDKESGNRTGGAYSEIVSKEVTKDASTTSTYWGDWSDWQQSAVSESDTREVEVKTQYSYRDKKTTTGTSPEMPGWTPAGSSISYGNWSNWSDWSLTSQTKSDTKEVETRTVYYYYHYCDGYGNFAPSTGYTYGKYGPHTLYSTKKLTKDRTSTTGLEIADGEAKCSYNCGSYYYGGTKTQYRYRTRTKTTTYSFWSWGEWSAYDDTVQTATENREVRSILVYRFRDLLTRTETSYTSDIGTEPSPSGTPYTVSGKLDKVDIDYSGKPVTVMVYKEKNIDPTQEQMEYITQITLGKDNSYTFTFTPKDEISAETGDYIVSFGIATNGRLLNNVERIEAPKPVYDVTFKNYDGSIITTQQVEEGDDATEPEIIAPEGYTVKWNRSYININKSIEISAVIEPLKYTIVFVDWANSSVVKLITDAVYGTQIEFPNACSAEGKRFTGWSIPEGSMVTGALVIEAQYEDITNTVKFLNRDGSEYISVTVPYGSNAELPEINPSEDGYQFLSWDSATPWWNVTTDISVKPVFVFEKTADIPTTGGNEGRGLKVSGFEFDVGEDDIFFTLDGSEPTKESILFTGEPIAVTETTILKARAFAPNKNPSAIAEFTIEVIPESSVPSVSAITNVSQYEIGEDFARICMKLENPEGYVINAYGFNVIECETDKTRDYRNTSVSGSTDTILGKAFTVSNLSSGKYVYSFFAEFDQIGTIVSDPETFEIKKAAEDVHEHTYDNGVITKSPTATETGIKTYTCTICGETKTEVLPMLVPDDTSGSLLVVGSCNTSAGKTVTIPVDFTKIVPMSYIKLTLTYDVNALTLTDVKNGGLFDTFESGSSLSFDSGKDVTETGNLVMLTFAVNENTAEGDYDIKIKCNRCYNANEDTVNVSVQNGKITVRNTILGDVNGDGEVDGRDLIRLRRYLANLDEETGISTVEITAGAEVTGNDEIDGRDLIRLRRYLANLDEDTGISTVTLG